MSNATNTLGTIGNVAGMIPGYGTLIEGGLAILSGITGSIQENQAREAFNEYRMEQDQLAKERAEQLSVNNAMQLGQTYKQGNQDFAAMYAFGNTNIAPANEAPERIGNETLPLSSTGEQVVGPSHENGGVPVPGSQAEVEGGEVLDNGMVFSNRLMVSETKTFADLAKEFELEKATNEKEMVNTIDKYLVDTLERKNEIIDTKLSKLFELQGIAKRQQLQQNI